MEQCTKNGSVTSLLRELANGDRVFAPFELWTRYHRQVGALVRRVLNDSPNAEADWEDVTIAVMDYFFRGVQAGDLPNIQDRNELWALLATITVKRAISARRRGRLQSHRYVTVADCDVHFCNRCPPPELLVEVSDLYEQLMQALPTEGMRVVASLRLDGHSDREISDRIGVSQRTVERNLATIRAMWLRQLRARA